jgi:cell division protein FtsB
MTNLHRELLEAQETIEDQKAKIAELEKRIIYLEGENAKLQLPKQPPKMAVPSSVIPKHR